MTTYFNTPTGSIGLVVLLLGALEVIKILAKKLRPSESVLLENELFWIRSMYENQNKITISMSQIATHQEKITYVLDTIVKNFDRLEQDKRS